MRRLIVAQVLLAGLTMTACGSPSDPARLEVGVLLPFSGNTAATGASFEHAMMGVRETINRQGGIGGTDLELVTRDTHDDISRAEEAARMMIDRGVVAVVGPESAEIALAIQPLLEAARVLFVSPFVSSGTQPVLREDSPWIRTGPSAEILARALARDALGRKLGRIAILSDVDDYSRAFAAALKETFELEGGRVALQLELPRARVSFGPQIEAVRAIEEELDAVALIAPPKAGAQVVNELAFSKRESLPLLLGPTLETDLFLKNTSALVLEGARGVGPALTEAHQEFAARFDERWGQAPLAGADFYHDATAMIGLALAHARRDDPEIAYETLVRKVRSVSRRNGIRADWHGLPEALASIAAGEDVFYQGLTGTMIMDRAGQRLEAGARVWVVCGGAIVSGDCPAE